MTRRSLMCTVLAGVVGAIGLTVFVGFPADGGVVAASSPVLPGARRPLPRAPMPLPAEASPRELRPLVELPDPDVMSVPAEPEPAASVDGRIGDLVYRLEEIEARRPLDFHHGAVAELTPYLAMQPEDDQRTEALDEALTILDEWELTPRVRGAVLALVGAWGGQGEVLARIHERDESWRSAVIGLLCTDSRAGEPSGLTIQLADYLHKVPRDDVALLALPLGRVPDATLHARLFDAASRIADDIDAWHSRNLAVLALGTSIDERPDSLDLMTRLLFDTTDWGLQVRLPACFVMAHARSDAAREVVLQFLEDPQTGQSCKHLLRWWAGDKSGLPRELEVLTAPLRDASASRIDKFTAVGSLLKRGPAATPEERAVLVGMLVEALEHEPDETLRLAMISTLAETPGGSQRLRVLEDALRTSPQLVTRMWAAKGLGKVEPGFEGQARGVLQSARPGESKPDVLAAIDEALLALE